MAAIATPAVIVNGVNISIKPNSLVYTEGFGEYKIRTASAGGARKEQVFTKDIESAYSMVKFTLYTTAENISFHREWKANEDTNTLQWVDSGVSRTVDQATVINEAEIAAGVDGEFEVTFHGNSAV